MACGEPPGSTPAATATDSSGISIVHNNGPELSGIGAWRIADTSTLDLGGTTTDPTQELFRVVGALRLDDGRIVVANGCSAELRFFAEDGTFLSRRDPSYSTVHPYGAIA